MDVSDKLRAEIEQGEHLFQNGKLDEALKIFESVLEKEPDNVAALNDKGVTLNSLGKYKEAIQTFSEVLRKDNSNSNAVFNLIANYIAIGDWTNAREIFIKFKRFLSQSDAEIIQKDLEKNISAKERLNHSTREQVDFNKSAPLKLDQKQIDKFEDFLEKIRTDTYPEPISEPHLSLTRQMFDYFNNRYTLPLNSNILDVGCGQGLALELFREKGFNPTGITLNSEDSAVCKQKGYQVCQMDQSFLTFRDQEFDFIWCRHCLEHSIFPYFTLSELFRVLKPKGYLYIEVPAPDTSCNHQTNQNHYSVLGKSMWIELIKRAGFNILDIVDISFDVPAGPDTYWAFIQQKPEGHEDQ